MNVKRDMKRRTLFNIALLTAAIICTLGSCQKEGQTIPAYITIDTIHVTDNPDDSWSSQAGFFSHLIDAAEIIVYQQGDTAESIVGIYQLPCKFPILKKGVIDYIKVVPVVKQNGIAATRIPYPFYREIKLTDVRLTPDSITDFGTLTTHYYSRQAMSAPWQEYFEPSQSAIKLDSCVGRISYKEDTVCSGRGCGVIRVSADQTKVNFWSRDSIVVNDPTAYVYLEMDYWSDFDFSVGFNMPTISGGNNIISSAMVLYANADATTHEPQWQKIYINLGRLWASYNYYPNLRLYFTIFNDEGHEGRLLLDNMKVVVM